MAVPPPGLNDKSALPLDKGGLRTLLRGRRRSFVQSLDAGRFQAERDIADRAFGLLEGASIVAGYVPSGSEVDPAPLLATLAQRGTGIALPFSRTREAPPCFRRWAPGEALVAGPFGTLQPCADAPEAMPDAIVAPLLGFDRERRRLGAGAGWYDRAFTAFPSARRFGLAWSVQQVEALPQDEWDVPLDAIVTERGQA